MQYKGKEICELTPEERHLFLIKFFDSFGSDDPEEAEKIRLLTARLKALSAIRLVGANWNRKNMLEYTSLLCELITNYSKLQYA